MKNMLPVSVLLVCVCAPAAFAQKKAVFVGPCDVSQTGHPASNVTAEAGISATQAWVRIILDKKFGPVWADAERTYEVARALVEISSGDDQELVGFDDMIKTVIREPLTREALESKFGKPCRCLEDGQDLWLDYGPIQFKMLKGAQEITTFRAQRAFYRFGFVKAANNSLKQQHNGEPPTK